MFNNSQSLRTLSKSFRKDSLLHLAPMPTFVRVLLGIGLFALSAGVFFAVRGWLFPNGVPGDFVFQRGSVTLYFPLVSTLYLSVLASVVLNAVLKIWR